MTASWDWELLSGFLTLTWEPTLKTPLINSSSTVREPFPCFRVSLHLTLREIFLIFASQKAPLYLALTSVPIGRTGGSSWDNDWNSNKSIISTIFTKIQNYLYFVFIPILSINKFIIFIKFLIQLNWISLILFLNI